MKTTNSTIVELRAVSGEASPLTKSNIDFARYIQSVIKDAEASHRSDEEILTSVAGECLREMARGAGDDVSDAGKRETVKLARAILQIAMSWAPGMTAAPRQPAAALAEVKRVLAGVIYTRPLRLSSDNGPWKVGFKEIVIAVVVSAASVGMVFAALCLLGLL